MANSNSDNPHVGRRFQDLTQSILSRIHNAKFEPEAAIPIGEPPKGHKFDLASEDKSIVVECKCYTWTDSGNVPSAKLMGLDEAVFYFSFLPAETKKILCMKKRYSPENWRHSRSIMSAFTGTCLKMFLCGRFQMTEQ